MDSCLTVFDVLEGVRVREGVRVLVVPDLHDRPGERKDRWKWIGMAAKEEGVDCIVVLGDIADWDSLNSHVRNDTLEGKGKASFREDLESVAAALMVFDDAAPAHIPRYMTLGNHEERMWRFENNTPEMAGHFTNPFIGLIDHYRWHWVRFGEYIRIGGVDFTHRPLNGMRKPLGGANAAHTVARNVARDTVFGDTHKLNLHTYVQSGYDNRVMVLEAGCALEWGCIREYARLAATGWWWGVHIVHIQQRRIHGVNSIPMRTLELKYK